MAQETKSIGESKPNKALENNYKKLLVGSCEGSGGGSKDVGRGKSSIKKRKEYDGGTFYVPSKNCHNCNISRQHIDRGV